MVRHLIKAEMQTDFVAVLERKIVRVRALNKELKLILDTEYSAGKANDQKSLKKLILRKQNCVNRFEPLVRSMGEQLVMMTGRQMPATMPETLVTMVKMIQGMTAEQEERLSAFAGDLEQKHQELMTTARRNGLLFKSVLERLSVTSKYVNQKNVRTL